MPNANIKFIAADMDGTLLDEQSQLHPEFFHIYQQLEKESILFAAASGRQYYSLLDTFSSLKSSMIFIAENGTLVMHKGKELYSCPLDKTAAHAILKQARLLPGAQIVLCGKKSAYIETQDPQAITEFKKYYHRCEFVDDLLSVDDDFVKVAICHFDGSAEHVHPTINSLFGAEQQVVISAKIWLDVMHLDASKGAAIKHLQNELNFTFEQTMSFGDYFNDVEMLQASYHSYAMENAHEGVKAHARFIAPSNREAGVLQVIRTLLK
jgi:Cof subfamily protein (haloacid dehalogenase superfamily)